MSANLDIRISPIISAHLHISPSAHLHIFAATSVIKLPLLFVGSNGEKIRYTLFDSGANLSCIRKEQLENLEQPVHLGGIRRLATASEGCFIEISERVTLDFYINDVLLSDEFLVVPTLSEDAIVGAATLQKRPIKLNFDNDSV